MVNQMTPKEKAQELIDEFSVITKWKMGLDQRWVINEAKRCALIAVGVIQKLPNIQYNSIQYNTNDESQYDYWQEVKQELEKL